MKPHLRQPDRTTRRLKDEFEDFSEAGSPRPIQEHASWGGEGLKLRSDQLNGKTCSRQLMLLLRILAWKRLEVRATLRPSPLGIRAQEGDLVGGAMRAVVVSIAWQWECGAVSRD